MTTLTPASDVTSPACSCRTAPQLPLAAQATAPHGPDSTGQLGPAPAGSASCSLPTDLSVSLLSCGDDSTSVEAAAVGYWSGEIERVEGSQQWP